MKLKVLLVLIYLFNFSSCEYFSATEEMKKLMTNQHDLIKVLKDLSNKIDRIQANIKRNLKESEDEYAFMQNDLENYVKNPLYGFSLIKRLTYDVTDLRNELMVLGLQRMSFIQIQLQMSELYGAVEGIYRLQETYQLKSEHIAAGIVNNKKLRTDFSPYDLLVLGKGMMKYNKNYSLGYIEKAEESFKAFDSESKLGFLKEVFEIYKSASDVGKALKFIDEILIIDPSLSEYEIQKINLKNVTQQKPKDTQKDAKNHQSSWISSSIDQLVLAKACRGELQKSQEELSKLHCRYVSKNYFTLIAPFKVVEMNLEPYVAIFLDVISDSEIEWLKASAIKNLERGKIIVSNFTTQVSNIRISKSCWKNDADKIYKRLSARVSDMSGLSMEKAEMWSIQNYGLGGHYDLHHDFTYGDKKFDDTNGNRIATALFYLSTVEMGGATVFPYLRLYVPAMKGTAVFWYNLNTSGGGEFKTRHSGCPVLFGSKWVANKWLRERGQEFKRPCELEFRPTDEDYLAAYNLEDFGIYI